MSIFDKLFKKGEPLDSEHWEFKQLTKPDFKNFDDLVELHAGLSFDKQKVFADVIGEEDWGVDMLKGSITFGELEFPIQVIGSLAFEDSSWMWSWANTQSGIPENLLTQSNKLKEIGDIKNIPEFLEPILTVEEGFEHKVGMLACGLFECKSYYCANYGQGVLVVTIDDEKVPEVDKSTAHSVLVTFPQLISAITLNHKNTFINYLIDRAFKIKISNNKIEAIKGNNTLVAEFDDHNRLSSLDGKLSK